MLLKKAQTQLRVLVEMALNSISQLLAAGATHLGHLGLESGLVELPTGSVTFLKGISGQQRNHRRSKGKVVVLLEVHCESFLFSSESLKDLRRHEDLLLVGKKILLNLERVLCGISQSVKQHMLFGLSTSTNHQRRDLIMSQVMLVIGSHACMQ